MQKRNCSQILQRVPLGKGNAFRPTKDVWRHLGGKQEVVVLSEVAGETRLAAGLGTQGMPVPVLKSKIRLPEGTCRQLGVVAGDSIVLIERESSLAVKRFITATHVGDVASLTDEETATTVTRTLTQRREPEELLARLASAAEDASLRYDPASFLSGRRTLDAWLARREWGCGTATDGALQDHLAQERLDRQLPDGSWGGDLVVTTRMLRELAALGMGRGQVQVDLGVEWLVARAESPYNPGMFFLTDALAEKQVQVVEARNQGKGGRFRDRKKREIAQVTQGDDHAPDPCAPRLMWPTAYAVEALIAVGWETHPRTQRALDSLEPGGWCECSYQHGCGRQRERHPLTAERIADAEARFRERFRNGGQEGPQDCNTAAPRRVEMTATGEVATYRLSLPTHIQPCETITVKCLYGTERPLLHQLCEAYLWNFASVQHGVAGSFAGNSRHVDHFFMLDVFSRYDHPASRIAIQRALPLLIESQNPGGSWGSEGNQDSATLIALRALKSIRWPATP